MAFYILKWFIIPLISIHAMSVQSPSKSFTCSDAPKNVCGKNAECVDEFQYIDRFRRYVGFPQIYSSNSICKCNEYFSGPPPNCKCDDDRACGDGEYCEFKNSTCMPGCSRESCPKHQYCKTYPSRECVAGCEGHYNCNDDEACDWNSKTCVPGCRNHDDCKSDEYCASWLKKCLNICESNPCPSNSKCWAEDHKKYCTCDDGFFPDYFKTKGCRQKTPADDGNINCDYKCGTNANCTVMDGKINCNCDKRFTDSNPFDKCADSAEAGGFTRPWWNDFKIVVALESLIAPSDEE